MDVRVVNLRDFRGVPLPEDVMRIDRKTKWGNPFKIGDPHPQWGYAMTRAVVVHEYKNWLINKVASEPSFLEPLRDKRLACWCSPSLCHGEAILEVLDEKYG